MDISKKQRQFLQLLEDPTINELLIGGAGGGAKSFSLGLGASLLARKYPGVRIFMGRKTLKSLKQSTINTLLTKVFPFLGMRGDEYAIHFQDMSLDYKNGSKIIFGELDTVPSDPDFSRIGSTEYDVAIVDEAGEITLQAKNAIKTRIGRGVLADYGVPGKLIISANPSTNFLYSEYYEPYEKLGGGGFQKWQIGEVEANGKRLPSYRGFLRMGAYDNPFLPQSYIDNLKTLPDRERKRILDGDWHYADDESSLFRSGLLDKATTYELPTPTEKFDKFIGVDLSDIGKDLTVFSLIENGVLTTQKTSAVQMTWEKDSKQPIGRLLADELVEFAQRNGFTQSSAKQIAVETNGVGASCLPPGELITTTNKKIPIEKATKEDTLYSKDGKPTSITQLLDYNYDGNIYEITPYGFKHGQKFTGEHPIWASETKSPTKGAKEQIKHDFQWYKTEDIKPLMWIREKNIYQEVHPMPDFSRYNFCLKPNRYATKTEQQDMNKIIDDEDFWWVVGYWLGDGWLQNLNKKGEVHFCYNLEQLKFQRKVEKWAKKINRKATHYRKPTIENSVIRCKQLALWFHDNFGEKAKGKYIPEWVKFIPKKYKIALLQGYFDSDGTNGFHPSKGQTIYRIGWSSVNNRLLEDIKCILDSLELASSIQRRTLRKGYKPGTIGYTLNLGSYASVTLNHLFRPDCKLLKTDYLQKLHNRRQYCYFEDGWIYRQIRKVEVSQYKGKVYNFSTEDETFMAGRIPTHNCRDFLRDRGWQITEYTATHKSRSENYYNLMLDMDAGDVKIYNEIYDIDGLRRELGAHSYIMENQEPSVVKKDKIKLSLGHSPDRADSFCIANYARRIAENPQLNPHTNRNRLVF